MKAPAVLALFLGAVRAFAGPFSPAAGQPGSDAVAGDDPRIVGWATGVSAFQRGLVDISDSQSPFASFGSGASALGPENSYDFGTGLPSTSPSTVVSLGDGGSITLTFANPLSDRPGPDLAVFENAFNDTFLELAFVEVSSDGANFVRFPAISLTQTDHQIAQGSAQFNGLDPTDIDGLAGKYRAGFGTPFDLSVLTGRPLLDVQHIVAVRVTDVVGSLDPLYGSYDNSPTPRLINDPWPTPFATGGFDLDAVAVMQPTPEPGSALLVGTGLAWLALRRRTPSRKRQRASLQSAPGMPKAARAFTLIELLVTLTIISVLAVLVLGATHIARDRGDAAQCVSNLRQLVMANLSYAAEHAGQYVPAQEPTNTIRWHGVRSGAAGKFDPTKGPLAPYLGEEGRVKLCPALRRVLTGGASFEDGTGGYGYNATYIGGTPLDSFTPEFLSKIARPSTTLMFADCAFARADGLQEYAYAEPWQWVDYAGRPRGDLDPSVHFRHSGFANVAWCDGHISAEVPSKVGSKNSYGGDAGKWTIGWFGEAAENGAWNPQRTQP